MSLITTDNGRIVVKKAELIMLVPYVYDSTISGYALGDDVYDVSAIIGDSTTIEQEDGDKTVKNNEFKASPLIECVEGGYYTFTAQCIDFQNDVLKAIFGAKTAKNRDATPKYVAGAAAMNEDYAVLYSLIRIRFKNDAPDVILPKVQMNSKLFIQQLKTSVSRGNINGTSMPIGVAVKDKDNDGKLLEFGNGIYIPYTPVLFVPKDYSPLFVMRQRDVSTYQCKEINFSTGDMSTVYVDERGNWSNSYTPV